MEHDRYAPAPRSTPRRLTSRRGLGRTLTASGADVALLTPQTVHGITGNLRRAGLVEAAPSAVHGRIQTLALTAVGQELLATCKARVAALEQDLAAGLMAGEEDVIRRWLVGLALPGAA